MIPLAHVNGPTQASSSRTTAMGPLQPYLRDAVIACVPNLTDDQLQRIDAEVRTMCHYALTSRMTDCAILIQGIAIKAISPLDADRTMWERMHLRMHTALCQPNDVDTRITSIDVSPASGLH
jgi:hypothetical protein